MLARRCSSHSHLTNLLVLRTIIFTNVIKDGITQYVYVKNLPNVAPTQNICKPAAVEDMWLTMQYRKLPFIIVGCLYRHPVTTNETFDHIHDTFRLMWLTNKNFFVLRDFNDDILFVNSNLKNILANT